MGSNASNPAVLSHAQLRFLPLAPLIVVLVGLLSAGIITAVGAGHLSRQADDMARDRSRLLALTVAERLASTKAQNRIELLEHVASRAGAKLLLARRDGAVLSDAIRDPKLVSAAQRLATQADGVNRRYVDGTHLYATPLGDGGMILVAAVVVPNQRSSIGSLLSSVGALTTLLISAAASVAYALARDVQGDVEFLKSRVATMASQGSTPAGNVVPIRSLDQIGALTGAFNRLVDRFMSAERAYRHDLSRTLAYDRDRSAFLAALSHELRTPLNAILGFTDVMLAEVDGPLSQDAQENMRIVRNSGEHLASLIDDIIDLSALESGELSLDRKPIDLFDVAREVVREASFAAKNKGLSITLRGHAAQAEADPRRVRQIIGNLVSNAVKFTQEGGVEVQVEPVGRNVAVTVTDTGPGIAPEEQAAIFEEYTQGTDGKSRGVGTGLGLAITRRLVRMHGGSILLASELEAGSRFTVVLPKERGQKPELSESSRPNQVSRDSTPTPTKALSDGGS